MLWITSLSKVPPGEYYIKEQGHTFGPSPLPKEVAAKLGAFRQANNFPRPGYQDCLEDLIRFTVERLGAGSEWVFETNATVADLLPAQSGGGCPGCGALIT